MILLNIFVCHKGEVLRSNLVAGVNNILVSPLVLSISQYNRKGVFVR